MSEVIVEFIEGSSTVLPPVLQKRLDEAKATLTAAKRAHAAESLKAQTGEAVAKKALAEARTRLREAEENEREVELAIAHARTIAEERAAKEAEREHRAAWAVVAKCLGAREKAALKAQKHIEGLVDALAELHELTAQAVEATPLRASSFRTNAGLLTLPALIKRAADIALRPIDPEFHRRKELPGQTLSAAVIDADAAWLRLGGWPDARPKKPDIGAATGLATLAPIPAPIPEPVAARTPAPIPREETYQEGQVTIRRGKTYSVNGASE